MRKTTLSPSLMLPAAASTYTCSVPGGAYTGAVTYTDALPITGCGAPRRDF